jgi:hypothetical protein
MKKIVWLMVFLLSLSMAMAQEVDINILGDNLGWYPSAYQGDWMRVSVAHKNTGNTRITNMKCELGFYTAQQVSNWGFALVTNDVKNIDNCVPNQANVDSVSINIDAGETIIVDYGIYAPQSNPDTSYVLFSECFNECWYEDIPEFKRYDTDKVNIDLKELGGTIESCNDGILNQDETDTDCGGNECKGCSKNQHCNYDSDCKTNNCENGLCGKCDPLWECTDWSECQEDGYRYRSCVDENFCNSDDEPNKEQCNGSVGDDRLTNIPSWLLITIVVVVILLLVVIFSKKK